MLDASKLSIPNGKFVLITFYFDFCSIHPSIVYFLLSLYFSTRCASKINWNRFETRIYSDINEMECRCKRDEARREREKKRKRLTIRESTFVSSASTCV